MADALTGGRFPTRTAFATGAAGIEPQASDRHEHMAAADVNSDPFPFTLLAVSEIASGRQAAFHEPGFAQDIRNRAGTIVTGVDLPGMTATPLVGFSLESVTGSDGAFDSGRGVFRRVGEAILQHRGATVLEVIGNRLPGFHLARARYKTPGQGNQEGQQE